MGKFISKVMAASIAVTVALPALAGAGTAARDAAARILPSAAAPAKTQAAPKGSLPLANVKKTNAGQHAFARNSYLQAKANKKRAGVPASYAAASGSVELYGMVVYSDTWGENDTHAGIYRIPTTVDGQFELVAEGPAGNYGGVPVDGIYYVPDIMDFGFMVFPLLSAYDMDNNYASVDAPSASMDLLSVYSAAYNPNDGLAYGVFYNADGSAANFSKVDYPNATNTAISAATDAYAATGVTSKGDFYAILLDGTLVKVDTKTGAATTIGSTGVAGQYVGGGTIDPSTDKFYYSTCTDDGGYLYEVNLETAAATLLTEFPGGEEVTGLFVLAPAAEDAAPAAPAGLEVSFPGISLSGKVSFTAPTTLFDGTAATGELAYTVLVDGEAAATGSTAFGAAVTADVTVAADGFHKVVVYLTNAAGDSPKVKKSVFVGRDTPEAPFISISYQDQAFQVQWTTPGSVNGGAIPDLCYTVTRYPGEVVVADKVTGNSLVDPFPTPDGLISVYYTVQAQSGDNKSAISKSNAEVVGVASVLTPPFLDDFADESSLAKWTIIDANGDGKTWKWVDGQLRINYNVSKAMDDWAISPAFNLEAGKMYTISCDFRPYGSNYPEAVEIKAGNDATAAAMTAAILAPTVIDDPSMPTYTGTFIPEADGTYYFGIHGISEADQFYLYADNFTVSAPASADMPAAVNDLAVTPDANGALKATVTFTTPSTTAAGKPLANLTSVVLLRGGVEIHTFEAPATGAALSYTDTPAQSGRYTYSVVACNAEGNSAAAEASAYVGINAPAAPTSVTVTENPDTYGKVKITWAPVTTDVDGNTLPAGAVKYNVADAAGTQVAAGIDATELETTACSPTDSQFVTRYVVTAVTEGGQTAANSNPVFVGAPYTDYAESVANGQLSHDFLLATNGAQWSIFTDANFSDIQSQDGDNGFFGSKGEYLDASGALIFGKVLIPTENPQLTFYSMPISAEDANTIEVVLEDKNGNKTTVFNKAQLELYTDGQWARIDVPLAAYAGQVVTPSLVSTVKKYQYTLIDNISIKSAVAYNLVAKDITAPAEVRPGNQFEVTVKVVNEGAQDATNFNVEFYANDELVATNPVELLAAGESMISACPVTFNALAEEQVQFYAVVNYAQDMVPADNTTGAVTVNLRHHSHPTVSDLTASQTKEGIRLNWTAPDLTAGVAVQVTEDFENAESFAKEVEGWTMLDLDGGPQGGVQNVDIPGVVAGSTTGGFFVMDASGSQFNATFDAHSGTKYLAALFNYDGSTINDWAISPALSGEAQTVSLYARSYSGDYPDKIGLYYSTGSTDPADFIEVVAPANVPENWTLYTADLPEGAVYLGIRACATDAFILFVDDVTFTRGDSKQFLELNGYNVYRNGAALHTDPVAGVEFHDTAVEAGDHTYHVTAQYAQGESAPVAVQVTRSGVEDALAQGVTVTAGKGYITICGATDQVINVYAADGKTVYSAQGTPQTTVAVLAGTYVVKAGNTVTKVLVK